MIPPAILRVEVTRADCSAWAGEFPYLQVTDAAGQPIAAEQESVGGARQLELEPGTVRVCPVGDDLIVMPQEVELAIGQTRTLRFAIAIGRSRDLVFNGDGTLRPTRETPLHVEVHRADGTLVLRKDAEHNWSLRGFYSWSVSHVFACGSYEVTARAENGRSYRATFTVRDDLEDPTQIDVPLVP